MCGRWGWKSFYVCPKTGILKRVKKKIRVRTLREKDSPKVVKVGDKLQCWLIGGTWYVMHLEPLPLHRRQISKMDVMLKRPICDITDEEARQKYGAEVYTVSKRPLSKREIKQWPVPLP